MATVQTSRPRNVNSLRAAGILYGDWGTSKAYVLGLAFALAGYSSFWFIFGICILTFLVGLNYILICKFYPQGGGVYASVRNRSEVLSLMGAFFLIADYLVTAALSALSAFNYLGVPNPEMWAMGAIALIGLINFLGPKHTGSMAIGLAIPTLLVILCLVAMSFPFLPHAMHQLKPISHDLYKNWSIFVGIIVALSGIEAIANTTGSMKLDPGSTLENPSVVQTSTPAIVAVMFEVTVCTALLGLAMNALPGLTISGDEVSAPGYPNVRDAMLRYMGETFAGTLFGPSAGYVFGLIISVVIMLLLLSAVNTAIVAMVSLLFIMSRDGELPYLFQRLNRFGVPVFPTLAAFIVPIALLFAVHDVAGLADLYAIGFVGAIAVNLGATSSNFQLPMSRFERFFMFGTFLIMALIEITLFIDKPHARRFVVAVVSFGLILRTIVAEQRMKKPAPGQERAPLSAIPENVEKSMLVAVTAPGKGLEYALQEASSLNIPLHILFIREQKIVTEEDHLQSWVDDPLACDVFDRAIASGQQIPLGFLYTVTSHPAHSIAEIAQQKKVQRVMMGMPRRAPPFIRVLRGSIVRDVSRYLPKQIDLVVVY
ncbi:MAG: APC family permease [Parachlamydia sp.]|nr:APC family permease [Parachlamydia sp.]